MDEGRCFAERGSGGAFRAASESYGWADERKDDNESNEEAREFHKIRAWEASFDLSRTGHSHDAHRDCGVARRQERRLDGKGQRSAILARTQELIAGLFVISYLLIVIEKGAETSNIQHPTPNIECSSPTDF